MMYQLREAGFSLALRPGPGLRRPPTV